MSARQEVLRFLREQTGDRKLTYESSLESLQDRSDVDMLEIVEGLESEFAIELPGEMLIDLDTVGDLCDLVLEAQQESTEAIGGYADRPDDGEARYTRL